MQQLHSEGKHIWKTKKTLFDAFEAAYLWDIFYEFPILGEFTFGKTHWNELVMAAGEPSHCRPESRFNELQFLTVGKDRSSPPKARLKTQESRGNKNPLVWQCKISYLSGCAM